RLIVHGTHRARWWCNTSTLRGCHSNPSACIRIESVRCSIRSALFVPHSSLSLCSHCTSTKCVFLLFFPFSPASASLESSKRFSPRASLSPSLQQTIDTTLLMHVLSLPTIRNLNIVSCFD